MKQILFLSFAFIALFSIAFGQLPEEESDVIYWETPSYIEKLNTNGSKSQYVYHRRSNNFKGEWIFPLNLMPSIEGFSEIYAQSVSKYTGREFLLSLVIPTLNCLWNDVIFLSPVHPHKHYEEYTKIGFSPINVQFYQIPVSILEDKRLTVWKWLSNKKYAPDDPIHNSLESYCSFDFALYQEMDDLPEDTKEFYRSNFDPEIPTKYPPFNWYRIPHILCQDPINITDPRITIINWKDCPD